MELIDKYSLVGADGLFSKRGCPGNCQHCGLWSNEGCRVILEAPTADAVEVVRCKDCEHSKIWGNNGTLLCYRDKTTVHIVKPDAYCDGSQRRYAADDPEVLEFEPVVHGHWIQDEEYYICSVCNNPIIMNSMAPDKFCKNCGAKMDG